MEKGNRFFFKEKYPPVGTTFFLPMVIYRMCNALKFSSPSRNATLYECKKNFKWTDSRNLNPLLPLISKEQGASENVGLSIAALLSVIYLLSSALLKTG